MNRAPVGRWGTMKSRSWPLLLAALAVPFAGCGTNPNEVLLQSATATGRTLIDLWLTDFENRLADSFDENGATSGEDGSTSDDADGDGDQGGDNDGDGDGPPDQGGGTGDGSTDLTGDPAAGQTGFTANNCAACHCADASGGCALSAPPIAGVASETIDARLRGDASHPLKIELSDQDLADLQAYLASLAGGGGDGSTDLTGDPAAGETVSTANNCAACHCADASGGCALSAPPIVGVTAEALDGVLRGDQPHPTKVELSDQDLADLQAYLASLG